MQQVPGWGASKYFEQEVLERENYFCSHCSSNFRKRTLAQMTLNLLQVYDVNALCRRLADDASLTVYETGHYNVFCLDSLKLVPGYVVSEYHPNREFGVDYNGVRNESLEALSYGDNQFDILITGEILEHVANLDAAILEIKRVLKPGGYHVFTVPVDYRLPETRERMSASVSGVTNLLPVIYHGDNISDGIVVFRDFGSDVLDVLSRDGFICQRQLFITPLGEKVYVFFSRKMA